MDPHPRPSTITRLLHPEQEAAAPALLAAKDPVLLGLQNGQRLDCALLLHRRRPPLALRVRVLKVVHAERRALPGRRTASVGRSPARVPRNGNGKRTASSARLRFEPGAAGAGAAKKSKGSPPARPT